jgi:hypothetical protein
MSSVSPLDEIEARAEKATPGPWVDGHGVSGGFVAYHGGDEPEAVCINVGCDDGDFIAHARTDIPALLATLELAREQRNEWIACYYQGDEGMASHLEQNDAALMAKLRGDADV